MKSWLGTMRNLLMTILVNISNMGNGEMTFGFRVILVTDGSPAQKAGLESYVDFIISANGIQLSPDKTLNTIISKSLNCRVMLKVYSILTDNYRDVQVQPSNSWGGDGLLGATVRWENWKNCQGLRILEVIPDSYAHQLSLKPREDYILGTESTSINEVSTFEDLLLENKTFQLFVLSSKTGKVRKIPMKGGLQLGCTVGEGMMNSIQTIEIKEDEKTEVEEVVVTVLKKKEEIVVPPPPPPSVIKEKKKVEGIVGVLSPPSIYDLSMESLTFQPKVLISKYVVIS